MKRSVMSLALFAMAACVHRSPEDAILSAFGPVPGAVEDSGPRPVYISFPDEKSARVFSEFRHKPGVVIAPPGMRLTCATAEKNLNYGYTLRATVAYIRRDSAVASLERICSFGTRSTVYSVQYLFLKHGRNWKLEKRIGANAMVM